MRTSFKRKRKRSKPKGLELLNENNKSVRGFLVYKFLACFLSKQVKK